MGVLREIKPVTQYPPSKYHRRAVASAFLNYGDEDGARGVLEELHGAFRRPNLEDTKTGKRKLARMDLGVKAAIEAFDGKISKTLFFLDKAKEVAAAAAARESESRCSEGRGNGTQEAEGALRFRAIQSVLRFVTLMVSTSAHAVSSQGRGP